jgi:biotin-dependent carboxylase-like uncharacterized protein
MIEVVAAGPLTTVQDLGRPGLAHLGVPRSGALDQPALALANRLVGNPPEAAGLEVTLSGCRLRAAVATSIAVTGAHCPVTVDGQAVGFAAAQPVPAGATIHIGRTRSGLRTYLAFAGGIDVPPVLGSRSTDTLCGLGPAPLRDGDLLPLGAPSGGSRSATSRQPAARSGEGRPGAQSTVLEVRVVPGPRADWFTEPSLAGLAYTVSPHSNRVGVRLTGPALGRVRDGELPSEGLVLGAVQVPADGQPVIFLADHPTTGGYPVIAVVHPADLPPLAQARPGATVRFRAGTAPG